jgi:hypothetical protein
MRKANRPGLGFRIRSSVSAGVPDQPDTSQYWLELLASGISWSMPVTLRRVR